MFSSTETNVEDLKEQHHARLKEYVESLGGVLEDGWVITVKFRKGGKSAGGHDAYFISPQGQRYRSRTEVSTALGLTNKPVAPKNSVKVKSEDKAAARTAAVHNSLDDNPSKKAKYVDHVTEPKPVAAFQKHTYITPRRKNVQTEDKCVQVTRAEIRKAYAELGSTAPIEGSDIPGTSKSPAIPDCVSEPIV